MKQFNMRQVGAIIFGAGMNSKKWITDARAQGYTVRMDGWKNGAWTFCTLWK